MPRCAGFAGPWQGFARIPVAGPGWRPWVSHGWRWRARPARERRDDRAALTTWPGADPALPLQPLLLADPHGAGAQGPGGGDHPLALSPRRTGSPSAARGWCRCWWTGRGRCTILGHRRIPGGRLSAPSEPVRRAGGAAVTRFVNGWTDSILHPWIARMVVRDLPRTAWRRRMPAISAKPGDSGPARTLEQLSWRRGRRT